jgi:uncharacterized oxidoreductase
LQIEGNTVLITGGGTGIGFALAEKFTVAGSQVIICGRRISKLKAAKRELPALHIKQCDISVEADRRKLLQSIATQFPSLNILVNNAGIQRSIDYASPKAAKPPAAKDDEVNINLAAPVRLCAMFLPRLLKRSRAAIVNISSGLAFVPMAVTPVYCATKSGIHSFTMSLRHQLRGTSVKVFEAVPPTTDAELDRSFAGEQEHEYRGISPKEVASAIIEGIRADKDEIRIGEAQALYEASMRDPRAIFDRLNS